jgi:hypothetical protein
VAVPLSAPPVFTICSSYIQALHTVYVKFKIMTTYNTNILLATHILYQNIIFKRMVPIPFTVQQVNLSQRRQKEIN